MSNKPRVKREPIDEHPLLEARHIDDLTQAVRALNATIAKDVATRAEDDKLRRTHEARQSASLDLIAKYVSNLPALMDLLVTKQTNGHGHKHHEESHDERHNDDA